MRGMSKFSEIGREDCRFYQGRSCYALKVFDCRLGNKCGFYQPDLSDRPNKARTYGANVRCNAKTEELRALMDLKKVKVKDMAMALYIEPDKMSKKLNARRVLHWHEAEKICEILGIPDAEFERYFRIEEKQNESRRRQRARL